MRQDRRVQVSIKMVVQLCIAFGLVLFSRASLAADVGLPVSKAKMSDVVRAEIIYEKYSRNVEFPTIDLTIVGPGGTGTSILDGGTGKQEENRILLRMSGTVSNHTSIHGDLGMTNSEDSEGPVPFFGAGLQYAAYNENDIKTGLFVQGHYTTTIEYKEQGTDSTFGPGTFVQKESYYEIQSGLTVAKNFYMDDETAFIPYMGAMISFIKGKEDLRFDFPGSGVVITGKGDLDENGLFAIIAGADMKFGSSFGAHVEGRFINQSSLSASLFVLF